MVGVSIKGGKLFGYPLDPLLVESKGKKKVLPTRDRPSHKQSSKAAQSFFFHQYKSSSTSSTVPAGAVGQSRQPWFHISPPSSTVDNSQNNPPPRDLSHNDSLEADQIPVGGHLQLFANQWDLTTMDLWVRGTIRYGYSLKFQSLPRDRFIQVCRPRCKQKHLGTLAVI